MNFQQLQTTEVNPQEKLTDMNIDNLPHQWKVVKLSNQELFAFENGLWTGKKEPFIECPVIRNTNFTNDGSLNFSNVAIIPIEQRQLEKKRLIRGDIIIERSGGGPQQPVGRVVFFDLSEGNYCFSNFTTRLRVTDEAAVDPRYLHLYLLYFHNSGQTERLQNHTTGIRNLAFEDYRNSSIPLPPLTQQHAIVKVLHAVQEAIQARRDELELERERKAALIGHLFSLGTRGESTKETEIGEMPESWQICRLEDIAQVAYGLTVNQSRSKSTQLAPYLTVANVTRGTLRLKDVKQIGMLDGDADRYRLQKGDVLLIEGNGNPALLGSAAMWNDELPFALHQNHLIRARPNQKEVLPNWLMDYLNSDNGRAQLLGRAKTSSGLHSINSQLVANLNIPLPSLVEQRVIVGIVQACNIKVASLEQETKLLEELFRALLEELMTGRLLTLQLIEEGETHD